MEKCQSGRPTPARNSTGLKMTVLHFLGGCSCLLEIRDQDTPSGDDSTDYYSPCMEGLYCNYCQLLSFRKSPVVQKCSLELYIYKHIFYRFPDLHWATVCWNTASKKGGLWSLFPRGAHSVDTRHLLLIPFLISPPPCQHWTCLNVPQTYPNTTMAQDCARDQSKNNMTWFLDICCTIKRSSVPSTSYEN